jgi:nitrous oxide reductase
VIITLINFEQNQTSNLPGRRELLGGGAFCGLGCMAKAGYPLFRPEAAAPEAAAEAAG